MSERQAALVCLTCKAGKRQCDKRLPVCSRCEKLNRPCEYPAPLPNEPAAPRIQPGATTHRVSPSACARCRANKRSPPHAAGAGADADTPQPWLSLASSTGAEVGVALDAPISYRPYMSQLLQFFLTSIALPSDTVMTDSLAHHLRSQWMQNAMTDPCLFHATLFSASASIDMLRGHQNTTLTLYHQTWAIRLVNERLAQREPVLTYGTLGAVIPLLYYNMVALDRDSAVAHQKGLVKMLHATPKSFRAGIGPLIAIVKWAMISFACLYDMLPIWDCLYSDAVRPNALLRNIVSRATLENEPTFNHKQTINATLDVYEAVSRLEHLVQADNFRISAEVETVLAFARGNDTVIQTGHNEDFDTKERINLCCQLTCRLFWETLQQRQGHAIQVQSANEKQENEIGQILHHLDRVEPLYWISHAPEVFTWIVFTGAAVSPAQADRVTFISRAGTVLTAVDDESLSLIRQGWRYFRLLRRLGGHDEPLTALGDD
ncbi:hypothetical protein BJY00DRAFT_303536 [Aspergillus carlsbadensis]|nr:hypothetical protein BJY00DRAFT_303536 [Aspergillus carlsbadensis]